MTTSATTRRMLSGATILGASVALMGSGMSAAAPGSSDSGGSLDSLGSKTQTSTSEDSYPFENWDTCPAEDLLGLDEDDEPTNYNGKCYTFVVEGGELQIGDMDIDLAENGMRIGGGLYDLYDDPDSWMPESGWLDAAPVTIPGGALGTGSEDSVLMGITAQVEEAGSPVFNPDLSDMWLKMPVKIKLENPLLGDSCYIGSDDEPIVFDMDVDIDTVDSDHHGPIDGYDGNYYSGVEASDDDFSVPEASGCGSVLPIDWVADLRAGLPSPSGDNSLSVRTTYYNGDPFTIAGY